MAAGKKSTGLRPLSPDDPRRRKALFTLAEAADYLDIAYSTLRSWARPEGSKPPLITTFEKSGQQATMPFVGFAEAFAISAAKRAGVPAHRIRPGVEAVRAELGVEYALAHRLLYTDGAELLIRIAAEDLEVARTKQQLMTDAVKNQLELITYGSDDDYAVRIQLPAYRDAIVFVDPNVAFGYPYLKKGGVRVKDILDRFGAYERIADIAFDLGITEPEVEDVIRARTKAAAA